MRPERSAEAVREKILIVDDEAGIRESLRGVLQDEGFRVVAAASGEEALEAASRDTPECVLLDVWMPGMDGLTVLERLKAQFPRLPVIIISGHGSIETAVRATKMGAFDFVEKPLSVERVLVSIQNALELSRLREENTIWRQKATRRTVLTGVSRDMERLRAEIERAAPTNATVLITGENGTGKELVARAIHEQSRRSERPLIEVNCAAIPEELIESELFGHEKGAFTGAAERRRGRFDLANGGTLFLDEIGDMSLKTQAKILRILQEQAFERVGGTRTIHVDVRIVAATNKALPVEIERGRFRQDLYYRLNVIPIHVTPLRERIEDIPALVEDFLTELAAESALGRKNVSPRVLALLSRHSWPGNVRELKNFIERFVIMTPGARIEEADLPLDFPGLAEEPPPEGDDPLRRPTLREARLAFEREYLQKRLAECGGNVSQTAAAIEVERSHLHRKLKALGIRAPDDEGTDPPGRPRQERMP